MFSHREKNKSNLRDISVHGRKTAASISSTLVTICLMLFFLNIARQLCMKITSPFLSPPTKL